MSRHDKTKSSGLLDSLFGRPKSKGKVYAANNGGRPISLESEAMPDMQEITNEIYKLTTAEVDQKFMEILDDMNIPKNKRQPLLLKSFEEKRDMLIMQVKGVCVFSMFFFCCFFSLLLFICVQRCFWKMLGILYIQHCGVPSMSSYK